MISRLDKIIFIRNLSVMLRSGISLLETLESLRDEARSKEFKKVISDIIDAVSQGRTISLAMSHHPKIFGDLIINVVKVGEESGTLEQNLDYLSNELEKDYDLRKRIRGALMYPILVLSAAALLGIGISYFLLPKLIDLFKSLQVELPLSTKIIMAIAQFTQKYGLFLFLALVALIVILRIVGILKILRPITHPLILKLPAFGPITRNVNLTRFNRIFGLLLKSGVPILDALDISANSLTNVIYKKELKGLSRELRQGMSLSSLFEKMPKVRYPRLMVRMIDTGEKTGTLDENLSYLSSFYSREVDLAIKNLSTILEPVLLVIIGLVVAFLAIAIISPIYKLTGSIRVGR